MSEAPIQISTPSPGLNQIGNGRAFYSAMVHDFLLADPMAIVGQLSSRQVDMYRSAESEQIRAWEREIEILRNALAGFNEKAADWRLLIEMPLLRLSKRLDALIVTPHEVAVIEFKTGVSTYDAASRVQVERYAQALRDFHEASQQRTIFPILCAEGGAATDLDLATFDGVAELLLTNSDTLADALRLALCGLQATGTSTDVHDFDRSKYSPTPTIIEAAQALYAGHEIADIGRGDAADAELQAAANALQQIVEEAEREKSRVICFVTGSPGAGKTLLGLDLALKSRSGVRSGQPP